MYAKQFEVGDRSHNGRWFHRTAVKGEAEFLFVHNSTITRPITIKEWTKESIDRVEEGVDERLGRWPNDSMVTVSVKSREGSKDRMGMQADEWKSELQNCI